MAKWIRLREAADELMPLLLALPRWDPADWRQMIDAAVRSGEVPVRGIRGAGHVYERIERQITGALVPPPESCCMTYGRACRTCDTSPSRRSDNSCGIRGVWPCARTRRGAGSSNRFPRCGQRGSENTEAGSGRRRSRWTGCRYRTRLSARTRSTGKRRDALSGRGTSDWRR
jgi:hypothetical protein